MLLHFRNIRLFVNAGMSFPECYSYPKSGLLDTDKGRLQTTPNKDEVTCPKCKRLMNCK